MPFEGGGDMLQLDEMKRIRTEKNMSYEEIAIKSGVSISSVQKIFGSDNSNPRKSTLEKLNKAFNPVDTYNFDRKNPRYQLPDKDKNYYVAETTRYNIYGKGKMVSGSGESLHTLSGYTYDDYMAMELPEGKRVEVIDGVVYDLAVPSPSHQAILSYLNTYLSNELRKRKKRCLSFPAPYDVRLDFDEGPTTVVQPDILIKCSKDHKVDEDGNELPWVPSFVLEILSPATRSKDMFVKTKKYKESGVVEYWMIDEKAKQVVKYNFEKDTIKIYGFDAKIGLDIFDGDIKVDMKDLQDYLDEYADIIGL